MMEARRTQEDSRRVSRGRMRVKAEGVGWSIDQEQVFTGNARRELFTRGPRGRNSAGRKFIYLLSPAREASATKILFSTESRLSCIATRSRTYVPRQLASKKLFHSVPINAGETSRFLLLRGFVHFASGNLENIHVFLTAVKIKIDLQYTVQNVESIVQYRVQSVESIVQCRV